MKKFALLLLLLSFAIPALAQSDTDGDGVDDSIDLCINEASDFFDIDGDGCPDEFRNTRHVEFWALSDLPFTYVIHEDGVPDIFDGSDFTAVQNGFAVWSRPENALSATYGGTTTDPNTDGMNGIHEVSFDDPDYLVLYGTSVIAVGLTTSFETPTNFLGTDVLPGQIVDADILFSPSRPFSTPTAGSGTDLESVAAHEAGHVYGLSHGAIPDCTLFPAIPSGTLGRTLEQDDIIAAFMAAPLAAELATANRIGGVLSNGADSLPIGGALILLLDAVTEEQIASTYTFPDGTWRLYGVPDGSYHVYAHPLDGSAGANNITPAIVNELVETAAGVNFVAEYWDAAESATDDSSARTDIVLSAGTVREDVDIISNVDLTGPVLSELQPSTGAIDVMANTVVLIAFDEALDFDSAVTAFRLEDVTTSTGVAGSLTLLSEGKTLVFYASERLLDSRSYDVILSTDLTDVFGNPIAAEIRSGFTTAPPPPLAVESVSPSQVVSGTTVVIAGQGFDASNAAAHTVLIDGIPVTPTVASATYLVATVPELSLIDEEIPLVVQLGAQQSDPVMLTGRTNYELARGTPDGEATLGGVPKRFAALPDGNFGYVAHSAGLSVVTLAYTQSDYRGATEISFSAGVDDVAAHPDGHRVYAISKLGRTLLVINSDYGDLEARDTQFNTVLAELALSAEPRAIAVDPDGSRAFLVMEGGMVQVWDVQNGSVTFHRQIGEITSSATNLASTASLDRSGTRLLLADTTGQLLIHDADNFNELSTTTIAADPRDVTSDPTGQIAYVSHGAGDVSAVSLISSTLLATVSLNGAPRGLSITPAGLLCYVANRSGDSLDVIDLNSASPGYRLVNASIELPGDPIDVAVSPSGFYVYGLNEQSQKLHVFAIGTGPELFGISPTYAKPGDIVRVWGTGFASYDLDWIPTITSYSDVEFDGESSSPSHSTGSAISAEVPATFTGGQVQVNFSGPVFVGLPDVTYSNPKPLRLLDPQPGSAAPGVRFGADGGFPADLPTEACAIAEDSSFGVYATATELVFFDADPSSPTFLQFLTSYDYSLEGGEPAWDIVIVPANKKVLVGYKFGNVTTVLEGDINSPSFGQKVGNVDYSFVPNCFSPAQMAVTPDGQMLCIADACNDRLLIATETTPGVGDYAVNFISAGFGFTSDMVMHPNGLFLYVMAGGDLHPFDINPFSPNFGQDNFSPVLANANAIDISPDGRSLYIMTNFGVGGDHELQVWDTGLFPWNPSNVSRVTVEVASTGGDARIRVEPYGRYAWIDIADLNNILFDLDTLTEIGRTAHIGSQNDPAGLEWWPDGSLMLFSPEGGQTPTAFSRYQGFKYNDIAGVDQTGVAGQRLPSPVSLQITDGSVPVSGVPVELKISGGGGTLGNGRDYQVVTTDDIGRFSFEWTLGPLPDSDPLLPDNRVDFSLTTGGTVGGIRAYSIADPDALPIALSSVLPGNLNTGVSVTSTVQAVFTRAVDRATINTSNFAVRPVGGSAIAGTFGYSSGDKRVSFIPSAPLQFDTAYEIVLSDTIADLSANTLTGGSTTSFTTQTPPALSISAISPPAATVGTEIVISGAGFDATASGNVVDFSGTSATATSATPTSIRVVVPQNALSGNLHVEALSQSSNELNFSVLVPTTSAIDEVLGIVDTGATIRNIAITPDGLFAYSVSTEADQVLPVDLTTLASLSPIPVGDAPVAIVIHPGGQSAYVANFGGNSVSVVDLVSQFVTATIPVGDAPVDLVMAPDGTRVYVVNSVDQTVSVIDTDFSSATFHTIVTTIPTGSTTKGAAITPDGGKLYLGTSDGFLVIDLDPAAFGVVTTVPTGSTTKGAAITPDGGLLILVTESDEVLLVDITPEGGNAVVTTVPTGSTTKGAAITPDGGLLYLIPEVGDEILVVQIVNEGSVSKTDGAFATAITINVIGTIQAGEDPEFLVFDPTGSGLAISGSRADGKLTVLGADPSALIQAMVEVTPRTLHLESKGRYISAELQLPPQFDVRDVDISTVRLNDVLTPLPSKSVWQDKDQDGIEEYVIKFDRVDFQAIMPQGENVPVWLTGNLTAFNQPFEAHDSIRTIRPTIHNPAGAETFLQGQSLLIQWSSPEGVQVATVDIEWSADNGESWMMIADDIPDLGEWPWTIPYMPTAQGLIAITIYDDKGEDLGLGMTDQVFGVEYAPVSVLMGEVETGIEEGLAVLRWSASYAEPFEGFHVLRADEPEGPFVRRTRTPLSAESDGFVYRDAELDANRSYWYKIQEAGSQIQHGPYELHWRLANSLSPNHPNPFNPRTTIRFALAEPGRAKLAIYDVRGRLVRVLLDTELRAREYTVIWDGRDGGGDDVAGGVYLYRLTAPGFVETKKMALVR